MVALTDMPKPISVITWEHQEFIFCQVWILYQGQYYMAEKTGDSSLDLPAECFINYLQNHDQIANTCRGIRVHRLSDREDTAPLLLSFSFVHRLHSFFRVRNLHPPLFSTTSPTTMKGNQKIGSGKKNFLYPNSKASLLNGPIGPEPSDPDAFIKSKLDFVNERLMNSFTAFTATFWKSGK